MILYYPAKRKEIGGEKDLFKNNKKKIFSASDLHSITTGDEWCVCPPPPVARGWGHHHQQHPVHCQTVFLFPRLHFPDSHFLFPARHTGCGRRRTRPTLFFLSTMQKLTRDSYHLSFSFLSARWPNIFRTLARDALKLLSWLFIFIFFNSFYLNYHFFFFFFL